MISENQKPAARKKAGWPFTPMSMQGTHHPSGRQAIEIICQRTLFFGRCGAHAFKAGLFIQFQTSQWKGHFPVFAWHQGWGSGLAILALADQAATCGPLTTKAKHKHHAKICHMLIERYFELKDQKPRQRLLTGNDLIKILKLKPSELFGKIFLKLKNPLL